MIHGCVLSLLTTVESNSESSSIETVSTFSSNVFQMICRWEGGGGLRASKNMEIDDLFPQQKPLIIM